jgi:vanillate O-demethylase ferredoxin subunit
MGTRQRYGESFGWIESIHRFLGFGPAVGEAVTGYTALVFGLIIVTGIVMWWPASRRALKAGLTVNPKLKGRPWNLNLHRAIGAYASVVLLVSVTTGVTLSRDWAAHLWYVVTGTHEAAVPKNQVESVAALDFNAVAKSIATVMPEARDTYIPMPKKGVIAAYAIAAEASHPNARSYVWMDPAGKILRFTPYAEAPTGFRIYYYFLSLHTGQIGGPAMPVLLVLGTLSVPLLAYTGAASYFRRRRVSRSTIPVSKEAELTSSLSI